MHKKDITIGLCLSCGLLLLIILLNLLIDPYDIFNTPKIKGFNFNKPESKYHARLHKAIAIQRLKPEILLLGTSRTEYGLNPLNKNFAGSFAYNCSFPGGLPTEYEYYINVAIKNGLKEIIIGTDFFTFYYKHSLRREFDVAVFQSSFPFKYLFSLDTFYATLKTIGSNSEIYFSKNGILHTASNKNEKILSKNFKNHSYMSERYYSLVFYGRDFDQKQTLQWEAFERILHTAHINNIKVKLFISPSHARQWEVLDMKVGYEMFEKFKRRLVFINENIAHKNAKISFDLWDFAGYNWITTEENSSNLDSTMEWYSDSAHYTYKLGDIMLDRMFQNHLYGEEDYSWFGTKITSSNIEEHLKKTNLDRIAWQANHEKDILEIQKLKKVK